MLAKLFLIPILLFISSCEIDEAEEIHGCCDEDAWNYNPDATHHTEDDDPSTCIYDFEFSNPNEINIEWIMGDTQIISWTGGDSNLNLSIYIASETQYADPNLLGDLIEENVPNSGTYEWIVNVEEIGSKRICFVQDINSDATIDTVNDLITYSSEFSIIDQSE
tara:strand:+ start:103 stop:594 length:492 start_codon:yes stop_codon:yes gene_type:complete